MIAAEKDLVCTPGQSLPIPNPGLSFWQRTTRAFPLLNSNYATPIPATSKYVIIGSGLSGSLTALSLIEEGVQGSDIVILEAREAVSGASSRNAGHVRPDAFRGFTAYAKVHGTEQALKIIQSERSVLQSVDAFVKKHRVNCDFHYTTTFDVCMTPEFAAYEAESFEAYKKAGGDVSHITFYEGEAAKRRTRVPGALSAYEWPAGASHPAKLAQYILQAAVSKGAQLFTHCPALQIRPATAPPQVSYVITTPGGQLTTPTIIHCTNAHASFLLPPLAKHIIPNRAQAHTLVPTPSFSGSNALNNTFSLRYSLAHFYSLIQRQDDGILVLGVSRSNPTLSAQTLAGRTSTNDSFYNEEICQDALTTFGEIFPNVEEVNTKQKGVHGEGLDHAWSGIIGMTTDSVPFVGPIEGLPGQWICAGHNGHGMARIFACAPGLAQLITGKSWAETGLPECFQVSEERLQRLAGGVTQSIW